MEKLPLRGKYKKVSASVDSSVEDCQNAKVGLFPVGGGATAKDKHPSLRDSPTTNGSDQSGRFEVMIFCCFEFPRLKKLILKHRKSRGIQCEALTCLVMTSQGESSRAVRKTH